MSVWGLVACGGAALFVAALASLVPFWLHGFSPGERRVFRAYAEALLKGGEGVDLPALPKVLEDLERMLVATSPTARLVIRHGAWLFDWLPLILFVTPRRFSYASVEQRCRVLGHGDHSSGMLLGSLFELMTFPIAHALAGTREGLAVAGVDRRARVAECRDARQSVVRRSAGGHR